MSALDFLTLNHQPVNSYTHPYLLVQQSLQPNHQRSDQRGGLVFLDSVAHPPRLVRTARTNLTIRNTTKSCRLHTSPDDSSMPTSPRLLPLAIKPRSQSSPNANSQPRTKQRNLSRRIMRLRQSWNMKQAF